jgi:hypothetical protein
MMTMMTIHSWDQAERWARTFIALSTAVIGILTLLRWPLAVLLKAALLAAIRATLRDEEARASLVRVVREQLLATELAQLGDVAERVEALERERPRRRRGA